MCSCFLRHLMLNSYFFPLTYQLISETIVQFSSVTQSCLTFATPWITARQASLSITNSRSLLKGMCVELMMPSSHLIFCCPLFLLPPIPPSIRVFSNDVLFLSWQPFKGYTKGRSHTLWPFLLKAYYITGVMLGITRFLSFLKFEKQFILASNICWVPIECHMLC